MLTITIKSRIPKIKKLGHLESYHAQRQQLSQTKTFFPKLPTKHEEIICYCCLLEVMAGVKALLFPSARNLAVRELSKTVHLADKKRQGP